MYVLINVKKLNGLNTYFQMLHIILNAVFNLNHFVVYPRIVQKVQTIPLQSTERFRYPIIYHYIIIP